MPFHLPITNLNGGELSPFLDARIDIAKYNTGLQTLENFLILPYGGIMRRPGTEFMGEAKFPDKRCRLFGFNFSTTTNFVLELGHLYCRFWSNGTQVLKGSADAWVTATAYVVGNYVEESSVMYYCVADHTSAAAFATDLADEKWVAQEILEIPLPYSEDDLRAIQFCPINDIIYLAHNNYFPRKITRVADDNWTTAKVTWTFPPTLDENIEQLTIDPSATTGTAITLTASAALWKETHVGSFWTIGHRRTGSGASFVQLGLGATSQNSTNLNVLGSWEFTTYGTWQGQVLIDRQLRGTTSWEPIRTYENSVAGQRNVTSIGEEERECNLRIRWISDAVAGTNPVARLEVGESKYYGYVEITDVTSTTVATARVRKGLWAATPTIFWAEAAFSDEQGHARTVALHEGRLMWGGTRKNPLRLYGSFVDDFENFRVGSNADNAIAFRITANESNPIQWMISQQGKLIIGTAAEEVDFGRSDDNDALSSTNVRAIRQSTYGSAHIQAKLVNEVIMFVQRQQRKIREYVFAFEKDGWAGPDLTVLANHISGANSQIVELAFQQQPDAVLWAVISSGAHIASMTYERDQNVVGWSRQITQGSFESCASIYGGTDPDEIWFAVKRTIGGVPRRFIERMHTDHRDEVDAEDKANYWYLDCASKGVFSDLTGSVLGLDHLEGMTVGVYADGGQQPDQVVSGGGIVLERPARNILVGLRYTSLAKPQKFNYPRQDGSVIGRKGRVHIATVRVYKSQGLEYSADGNDWTEVTFREDGDSMDASPSMLTGDQRMIVDGGYEDSAEMSLRSSEPFPLVILAIIPEVDYHGS